MEAPACASRPRRPRARARRGGASAELRGRCGPGLAYDGRWRPVELAPAVIADGDGGRAGIDGASRIFGREHALHHEGTAPLARHPGGLRRGRMHVVLGEERETDGVRHGVAAIQHGTREHAGKHRGRPGHQHGVRALSRPHVDDLDGETAEVPGQGLQHGGTLGAVAIRRVVADHGFHRGLVDGRVVDRAANQRRAIEVDEHHALGSSLTGDAHRDRESAHGHDPHGVEDIASRRRSISHADGPTRHRPPGRRTPPLQGFSHSPSFACSSP